MLYTYIYIYPSCKASPHRAGQGLWCWEGFGTEKCDFGNCASPHPHPHPDSSENVRKQQKKYDRNMKKLIQNEIKRPPVTLPTHPFEIQKAWFLKIWFVMNFGSPKVRQRYPKWAILGTKRRQKTHQEIIRKSVSKQLKFWCQNHAKTTPTLAQNITANGAKKMQQNMSRKL